MEHAKELDRNNKNTLWMDTLAKEKYDVGIALKDDRTPGVGCKNGLHQEGLVCLRQT